MMKAIALVYLIGFAAMLVHLMRGSRDICRTPGGHVHVSWRRTDLEMLWCAALWPVVLALAVRYFATELRRGRP